MRTIAVSIDTFAAIWSHRRSGEETEDAILQRLLGLSQASDPAPLITTNVDGVGFIDTRNDVKFDEGFEIFRTYKGKEYRARATNGVLILLNTRTGYNSLHKLSQAVVHGNENSWYNWKYLRPDGSEAFIHGLRDPAKVPTRLP
ncbi:MAG TPA: hypothetical protein VN229_07810 [Terriglobales bacterium]|nr:hypothetical protein [Terriglobales bacterium]